MLKQEFDPTDTVSDIYQSTPPSASPLDLRIIRRLGILRPAANPILFTYPTAITRAFIGLVASGELQSYMKESLLVLLYASILAVVVGVFLGVVMGRFYRRLGYGYLRQRALFHADGCDGPSNRAVVWLQGSG